MTSVEIIRPGIAVFATVLFVCFVYGTATANQEQDMHESSGFIEAKKLEGPWVREEGGYVLILQDIKPDGTIKAFYLNPRSINVHVANWKFEDDRIILYVEMRDVNYPGSNYTLMYRASNDVLWGSYYQAVQKQTMDVRFVRTK